MAIKLFFILLCLSFGTYILRVLPGQLQPRKGNKTRLYLFAGVMFVGMVLLIKRIL